MKPDRSNYEIWFIELLDGNLNKDQVEVLKVFLEENPDLQEEFNDLAQISLEPSNHVFTRKKDLFKTAVSYTESQFENLCIAGLENDLTPGQRVELNEIIDHDESKRKQYELYQKLKLKPLTVSFKRKRTVKKITEGQKIVRWSFAVLSAAATIAILILLNLLVPSSLKQEPLQTLQSISADTLLIELRTPFFAEERVISAVHNVNGSGNADATEETRAAESGTLLAENNDIVTSPDITRPEAPGFVITKIPDDIISDYELSANDLMAFNPDLNLALKDERDNERKVLAKFFHEKIMKDSSAVQKPVESFDIARAGITGLNKLLGWDMSLQKNTGENGEIKSYYFSSRLLKFKAPVKKSTNNL